MYTLSSAHVLLLSANFLLIAAISNNTLADSIYKSVDKSGKITYSSSPTENHQNTVKVNILPPPSEENVRAAQQRHQQNLRTEIILDESRQKHSQEIAEKNRIRREKNEQLENYQVPEEPKEEGPYYGIPGHGILVLPGGPKIRR